jgi:hypothetical protein
VNIAGATSATYTIASPVAGDAANYDCVVTNACGSATSNAVALTVSSAPAITTQPAALVRCVGTSASFTVAASGTAPLSYQWRKTGVNIAGATSATYTIASPVAGDAANYDCVVTNSCGSATSNAVALTVNSGPSITTQPVGGTINPNASFTFTTAASGTPTLTYQWRKAGVNIAGATAASYNIPAAAFGNSGSYDCVVTNGCGSTTTSTAVLNVVPCVSDVDDGTGSGIPDGGTGIEDLLYYLGLYDSGNPRADVDDGTGSGIPDGGIGIEDLLYYLTRYDAGC